MCCVKVNKAIALFKSVGPHASYCLLIFTTTQHCTSSPTKLIIDDRICIKRPAKFESMESTDLESHTQQFDKLTKISMQLFSPTKANTI